MDAGPFLFIGYFQDMGCAAAASSCDGGDA
jgi:hypothetical protein